MQISLSGPARMASYLTVSLQTPWLRMTKSDMKMQGPLDRVSQAHDNYDLTLSTEKNEVVYQASPGKT